MQRLLETWQIYDLLKNNFWNVKPELYDGWQSPIKGFL